MKSFVFTVSLFVASVPCALAQESPAPQPPELQDLESRVAALEASAAALRRQADEALAALAAARAEIEALKTAQTSVATPTPALDRAAAVAVSPANAGAGANANAFNPAISVVLDGKYAHHSLDPDAYARSGFPLVGEGEPTAQGLSLGESEISLSANVDDKFYGQLTLAAESEDGEDEIGIEEAYIETTALPAGFTLRAGRFFSNIGYLNTHHAHTDKFPDRPLAYQALLGNQFGDDGVQVRMVAPTDFYLELGAEALRGQSFPSGGAAHDGVGAYTVSAHAGGDVGVEHSWLAGVSMLDTTVAEGEDGFIGDARFYIVDATWKWAPDGNTKDGGVQVRAEYIHEDRGELAGAIVPFDGTRSGAYVESVYRINRRWETGYRYDRLRADDSGPFASEHDPYRHGVMLTWLNSEFSLLRLLLSRDYPTDADTDTVVTLQYQAAFGAHGAHKF